MSQLQSNDSSIKTTNISVLDSSETVDTSLEQSSERNFKSNKNKIKKKPKKCNEYKGKCKPQFKKKKEEDKNIKISLGGQLLEEIRCFRSTIFTLFTKEIEENKGNDFELMNFKKEKPIIIKFNSLVKRFEEFNDLKNKDINDYDKTSKYINLFSFFEDYISRLFNLLSMRKIDLSYRYNDTNYISMNPSDPKYIPRNKILEQNIYCHLKNLQRTIDQYNVELQTPLIENIQKRTVAIISDIFSKKKFRRYIKSMVSNTTLHEDQKYLKNNDDYLGKIEFVDGENVNTYFNVEDSGDHTTSDLYHRPYENNNNYEEYIYFQDSLKLSHPTKNIFPINKDSSVGLKASHNVEMFLVISGLMVFSLFLVWGLFIHKHIKTRRNKNVITEDELNLN